MGGSAAMNYLDFIHYFQDTQQMFTDNNSFITTRSKSVKNFLDVHERQKKWVE